MKSSSSGFTLIEIAVVMLLIAILAGFAFPIFIGIQERAQITQDLNNLRQLGIATQTYLNDHDGILFSTGASAGTWMTQLHSKYLPSWKIFQSSFDQRPASENDATAPISYGLNGNPSPVGGTSIAGLSIDKVTKPSVFIVFAPAQAAGTSVIFSGLPTTAVTVYKAGPASGGTQNKRTRINALFADLHTESLLWNTFINDTASPTDPDAPYRWSP